MVFVNWFLEFSVQSYLAFFAALGGFTASGGWIVFVLFFFVMLFRLYMLTIQRKYIESLQWVFFRVRVPEDSPRNPRSMEEVLNALHGIQKPPDLLEQYLDGYVQSWLSLEIRGTSEGVSFIIRAPAGNREMVEAAIYAQYPDAEIEEVADYMAPFTLDQLDREFDVWGTEMILNKEDAYPIKTYIDFEDQFAEEGRLVDPMATISEFSGALKPGEELWLQILARPVFRDDWQRDGMNLALKLAGREVPRKPSKLEQAFGLLGQAVSSVVEFGAEAAAAQREEKGLDLGVLRLTPGETEVVRAIQRNVSKVAFEVQIRHIYVAPLAVYNRRARISQMLGMFRQFSSFNLNSFRPSMRFTTSRPTYGLVKVRQRSRKRRLLRRFRERYFWERGFVFNTEELATIYHFPAPYVKAPAMERTRARRGEAPQNIPLAPEDLPLA